MKGPKNHMASTQTNPGAQAPNGTKQIKINRSVFDLDSKSEVEVVKSGTFTPVANMQEFVERLGNDSSKILEIVNDGLEEYAKKQLADDSAIAYMVADEEGTLVPFEGTLIGEEATKRLQNSVLQIAKMTFGYPEVPRGTKQTAEQMVATRAKKVEAKNGALEMLLANPAVVESLKK